VQINKAIFQPESEYQFHTLRWIRKSKFILSEGGWQQNWAPSADAFKYKGVVVWFAAFSDHCSLFPTTSIVETFKEELKHFPTFKGTIHFPLEKPLPAALVRKLVKARIAEIDKRKKRH
jgi:uncharacterized protein YdhG (YjbR/CyaY superfamily)